LFFLSRLHHASEIALSDDVRPVATHSKSALLVEPLLAVGLQRVRVELRRIVAPPFTALPCVHRVFHFRVPLGNAAATMTTAKSSLPRFHFRTEDFAFRAELVRRGHKEQPEKQGEEQQREYRANQLSYCPYRLLGIVFHVSSPLC
jgi:hypothetical protein